MWWFRTSAAAAAIVALTGLASCGFKPLYGSRATAVSNEALSRVRVVPMPDRMGQLLYTHLTKGFHARGKAAKPLWLLTITLSKKTERLGIRKDETATRANLTLAAKFELKNIRTPKLAFRGRSVITNSYDILSSSIATSPRPASRFGTIASERNALERATRALGENIKTRVAIFLAGAKRRR